MNLQGEPIGPRFDGYYLSDLQRREEWHAGVRMVDEYYRYLKLFEHGVWLAKDHPAPNFDFPAYLGTVTEKTIQTGIAGRDPLDEESDFMHQCGRFSLTGDRLEFAHRHFLIDMHEAKWELRMMSQDRLVTPDGIVYHFGPTTRS